MLHYYPIHFIPTFIATIAIEYCIALLIIRPSDKWSLLLWYILMHCVSYPLFTYGFIELQWNFYLLEFMVCLLESMLLYRFYRIKLPLAVLVAFVANGISLLF